MHAVVACSPAVFFVRFSFDPYYYDLRRRKFHLVACLPAVVLRGENHIWWGKRLYINTYGIFSPGNSHISWGVGGGERYNLM